MTATAVKVDSGDLATAIRKRYEPPEWHVVEEVTLAGRRLDMVAFNLWNARRYRVIGFELKVSRGDWLRELRAFEKAEEWQRVVDDFYLVTPPKLVKADELPVGWGHLELCGSRFMTRSYPAKQEPRPTLPRELIARFLGRQAKLESEAERTARWRAEDSLRKEAEDRLRAGFDRERKTEREELEQLRRDHAELLEALGVRPREWGAQRVAMKAAGVLARYEGEGNALREQLARAAREIGEHHGRLQEALASLEGS